MERGNILIIEDDAAIREGVRILLEGDGFLVEEAENGVLGLEKISDATGLVILDVMMPGISGIKTCEEIRKKSKVPVLFLTAKGQESDKLLGLTVGGDDYLVKPFSLPVLHAKMLALLRRAKGMVQQPVLAAGGILLEPERYRVCCDGEEKDFSYKEYELLKYLLEHKEKVCTREELLTQIWGYDFEGNDRVVDNHIKKIRKKLGAQGQQIRTVFRKGYQLKEDKKNEEK